MKSHASSMSLYVVAAFIAILLIAAQNELQQFAADDAFLHFRIAENFVHFGRPYFNPDEAVMATSSPLWTLVLSVLYALFRDLPGVVPYFNALITITAGVAFARLAILLAGNASPALSSLAFLSSVATLAGSSLQLMETPLAMLLVGAGYLSYFRGRVSGFILLSLAIFCRLECIVFFLVAFFENLWFRRVSIGRALGMSAGIIVPFMGGLLFYFGSIVPQTVVAKAAIYHLSLPEFLTLATAGYFGKYVFYTYPLVILCFFALVTVLGIYSFLFHLHPPEYLARDRRVYLLLGASISIFCAYAFKKVYLFPWYMPVYTTGLVVSLLCLAAIKRTLPLRLLVLTLCAPPIFVFLRDLSVLRFGAERFSEYEGGVRAVHYGAAGRLLASECRGCTVLAAEIGRLGHAFRGRIHDAAGLATPQAVKFHTVDSGQTVANLGGIIPAGLIEELRPDAVVALESFLIEVKDTPGLEGYVMLPFDVPESMRDDPMRIYKRRDLTK